MGYFFQSFVAFTEYLNFVMLTKGGGGRGSKMPENVLYVMYGWAPRQLVNPVIIEEKQDDSHMKSLKTDCFKTVTEKSANGMIETSFS